MRLPPVISSPSYPDHMRQPISTDDLAEPDSGYEERDEASDGEPGLGMMVGLCACCCTVFVGLILLLCSFQGLHATEYGLTRNKMNGIVNFDTVHSGGRNFIGFWNEYLTFPATIQSIEWLESVPNSESTRDLSPMNVRTSDGLTMRLGVVVQYQINADLIPDMYRTYRFKYEGFFTSNLRSSLQVLVANYKAEDLWVERKHLAQQMKETCDSVCANRMNGMLTCWGVQLLANHLDPKIEARIVQRQVEVQKQELEHEKQKTALIRAETNVLKSNYELQIGVVKANATAYAARIVALAKADAGYNSANAQKTAMTAVQTQVKANGVGLSSDEVVTYMEKTAIMKDTSTKMYYGEFQNNEL